MKKKWLIALVSAALTVSISGCGAKNGAVAEAAQPTASETAALEVSQQAAEETAGTSEEAELQTALDELAAALDNTCWIGMDAKDYSCYAMGFGDGMVAIYSNAEGDEGVEGYWNIGVDSLYVYDDPNCTNQILEIPWSYDEENDVMILNDRAVMSQVEGDIESAATAMEQYATAMQVGEFLDSTVWAGADANNTMVMAFTLKDGEYYMGITNAEGNAEEHQGRWSIDYDSIYLYDEQNNLLDTLSWDMAEDGSELYFTVNSSQITFNLVQTDADNIEDSMMAIANEIFAQ